MQRTIVWETVGRSGLEHLELVQEPRHVEARGLVVMEWEEGATLRVAYRIRCDGGFRFTDADLTLDLGGVERRLSLVRRADGAWQENGHERPDLAGCTEVDLMVSPFTNTLPIRNLGLAAGEAKPIRVAYIRAPDLAVQPFGQEYTRLDPAEPPRRFLYRNLTGDFAAELAVDRDGVVEDYAGRWSRRL